MHLGNSQRGSAKYRRWRSTEDAHKRFLKRRGRLDPHDIVSEYVPRAVTSSVPAETAVMTRQGSVPASSLHVGQEITIVKKTVSKPKIVKRKAKPPLETSIQDAIHSLPYEEGTFRFIPCDRNKATKIQQWIYGVNKNHVHGWVIATRYSYERGGLLTWRMA